MSKRKSIIISIVLLLVASAVVIVLLRQNSRQDVSKPSQDVSKPNLEQLAKERESEERGERALKQLEEANPLVQYLPYRAATFEVHYKVSGPTGMEAIYKVILRPQTKPSDAIRYKEEINQLTESARQWIKSKGFDPDKIPIEWTAVPLSL